jgi:psp operon transcriptional activator
VRELKNAVERSVYRSESPETPISKIAFDPFDSPFKLADAESPVQRQAESGRAPLLPTDLLMRLNDMEREFLEAALSSARFNQRLAADLLGLSYHQFRGKLRKHEISGRPTT